MSFIKNPAKTWNSVSKLPIEQSLIAGGCGSLAFFEILGYAQTFLQSNMEHMLDILWPQQPAQVSMVSTVLPDHKGCRAGNAPLIAREGNVGAMILTKSGIFYLRNKDLFLFVASATYEEEREKHDFAKEAVSKLSPHAFALYHKAAAEINVKDKNEVITNSLKKHFKELLEDCLLHMILNDLSLLCFNQSTSRLGRILALDLFQKITLSREAAAETMPTVIIKKGKNLIQGIMGSFWTSEKESKDLAAIHSKTSGAILLEWVSSNKKNIKQELPSLLSMCKNKQLFFRNSTDWKGNSMEINYSQQQWRNGFQITRCMWEAIIDDTIKIELELCPRTEEECWNQIARLRYSIF